MARVVVKSDLKKDLRNLGIREGDIICVHSSLSRLGLVIGGVRTVVESLVESVGEGGSVMMPTYSGDLSDPAAWRHPAVEPQVIADILRETPAFDPVLTPSRNMGAVPEYFRKWPGVVRSPHPQSSFSALGKDAVTLCGQHPLDYRFGFQSPLGKLYNMGAKVVLMGAPWNTSSVLYLTEHKMPDVVKDCRKAPVQVEQQLQWLEYQDIVYSDIYFKEAIQWLLDNHLAEKGLVGEAESVIFKVQPGIDSIVQWRLERKSCSEQYGE